MSLTDNFKNLGGQVQQGAKTATISLTQRLLRLITGFFIGVVIALIAQEFTGYGTLVLLFATLMLTLIIFRLLRALSIWQIIVFDVICVLVANSLRMYIMMAP